METQLSESGIKTEGGLSCDGSFSRTGNDKELWSEIGNHDCGIKAEPVYESVVPDFSVNDMYATVDSSGFEVVQECEIVQSDFCMKKEVHTYDETGSSCSKSRG